MTTLELRTVTVYEARRDGRVLGFALDQESLIDQFKIHAESKRTTIDAHQEVVAIVDGELVDWNAGNPGPSRLKVHWFCPQCGQQHFDDWLTESATTLRDSLCDCVRWWVVRCAPTIDPETDTSRERGRTKR